MTEDIHVATNRDGESTASGVFGGAVRCQADDCRAVIRVRRSGALQIDGVSVSRSALAGARSAPEMATSAPRTVKSKTAAMTPSMGRSSARPPNHPANGRIEAPSRAVAARVHRRRGRTHRSANSATDTGSSTAVSSTPTSPAKRITLPSAARVHPATTPRSPSPNLGGSRRGALRPAPLTGSQLKGSLRFQKASTRNRYIEIASHRVQGVASTSKAVMAPPVTHTAKGRTASRTACLEPTHLTGTLGRWVSPG